MADTDPAQNSKGARKLYRRLISALVLFVAASMPAAAAWKEYVWTDRLTNEKHLYMTSVGRGSIRQFGHSVTSQLMIVCSHSEVTLAGQSDFHSAVLDFSEMVAIGDVQVRYRFDNGPVTNITLDFFPRGKSLQLMMGFLDDLADLRASSKFRVEVSLPWAGDPVIEFDTVGAAEAIDRVPCGGGSSR